MKQESISLKGVKILGVSSPATIKSIADEKGLNPQEVFVRVTFESGGKEYTASNKLRFFKQKGYDKLLEAKKSGSPVDVAVTETGFIYLEDNVKIEDLFKEPVDTVDSRSSLETLFDK